MTKLTKKDYFNALLSIEAVANDKVLSDFINHELDLLAKKSLKSHMAASKTQVANVGLKKTIIQFFENHPETERFTVTEIQKGCEELQIYSNQKLSALIRQLVQEGRLERIEDKRKAYFSLN